MDRIRRAHVDDVAAAVANAGGRVIKTLGDGAMASFESALGALRAAAAIQIAVERLDGANGGIGIAARVGVAAGEPIADGDDLHGMAVVIASRLSSAAGAGEVLVQDLVAALVASRDGLELEEVNEYELKGVPTPVRASRLRWREFAKKSEEPTSVKAAEDEKPVEEGLGRAGSTPLPQLLAAYADEPLIGRDDAISMLREATEPRPGRHAVLILGEPGIGKTRHAAAAAAEAHAKGALVVMARCPPEPTISFEPWVRAIGELALAGDDAWRAGLAEAAGAELGALVPELSEHRKLPGSAGADEVIAAEGARYRLLQGIGSVLARAADGAPLHIVLDDAHWCDAASAQALERLLERAPGNRMVVMVTARDREMGRRHPASLALADLRRTGDLSELRLGGLDAAGLAELVGAKVGRAITPQLAEGLQARTAGNPFFAGELARDLDQQGALREAEALESAPVPEVLSDLVEERLGRLEPETEQLLCAIAAIGPSAPVDLAAKAAGLDPAAAERAVQEALSERLVDDQIATEPTVAFPHALVREALIATTSDAARARLHLSIARALESDPDAEPAELARHYGLSVGLAGAEPAIAAYRAAARAAAAAHDHEQAAVHTQTVLSLLDEDDLPTRAPVLLELGEQRLLSADLLRARQAFRDAVKAARATGDAGTLARAALGFAGGDIGFGWEAGTDDPDSVALLREGLEALGESEPRLALRMVFRLAYLEVFSVDHASVAALALRAAELAGRLGDSEAQILARFTSLVARFARYSEPLEVFEMLEKEALILAELASDCDREDLVFRVIQWTAAIHYISARIPECEEAIERLAEIAARLGSPRFSWEVDLNRGMRLLDRGDRAGGEALVRRAGSVMRRLRPDIQMIVELALLATAELVYDGEGSTSRLVWEAMEEALPRGLISSFAALVTAEEGDLEEARKRMRALLSEDLEPLRRPDGHLPVALCALAHTACLVGDVETGERLRALIEPLRSRVVVGPPAICFSYLPEATIGRLELLAGRPEAAAEELREAVARADAFQMVFQATQARVNLARALQRSGDSEEALAVLVEGESIAQRYGVGAISDGVAEVRAEIEGSEPAVAALSAERARPIRALASRGGRRALAATVRGLDDAEVERRFIEPRRQRALLKGIARGFQPAMAAGFSGLIAYELEPFSIEPPPDAPWRWAIEVDSQSGRARLREPAPLDAAVTVHFGLAEWVRVLAGTQDPLTAMVAGRCSVEGDVILGARLQAMFGAR